MEDNLKQIQRRTPSVFFLLRMTSSAPLRTSAELHGPSWPFSVLAMVDYIVSVKHMKPSFWAILSGLSCELNIRIPQQQ